MSRLLALLTAAIVSLALVSACGGGGGDNAPEETEAPKSPLETAERWLELWADGKYAQMYDLVSTQARTGVTEEDFVDRYAAIKDEARITEIEYTIEEPAEGVTDVPFHVVFKTSFFGDIPQDNVMPMVREEVVKPATTAGADPERTEEWHVEWAPSLYFKELDDRSLVHFFTRVPRRGSVFDRHARPLAVDADLPVIGIVPDLVIDQEAVIFRLAQALNISDAEVRAPVTSDVPSYYFVPVRTLPYGTPTETVQIFRDMVDLGVVVREETQRVYPYGDSAAHVLGYMTEVSEEELETLGPLGYGPGDMVGTAGLEGQYDDLLSGKRGALLATVTPEGTIAATIAEKATEPGQDIFLALDINIQKRAELELGDKVGALVAMDPRDNAVLALASFPRFDPNAFIRGLTNEEADAYFNDPRQPFLNRALLAEYAPGSTFKVVTASAGLEKAGYTSGSSLPCPPVWTGLGEEFPQKNWQTVDRGYLSIAEGLMASCNPVFFEIGKQLDIIDEQLFPDFIRQFGFGSPTGIGMEEASGNVPDAAWKEEVIGEAWYRGDAVNMAIGQGYVTATPLQIANVYSALAVGGVLRKPLLILRVGTAGSAAFKEYTTETINPLPISQDTLDTIRYGLYLVTQGAGGSAYGAWVGSSVDAAGKSGTAEDLSEGSDHIFFAAYAQRSDPSMVGLGALEVGESGSREVAPMLRHLLEAYIGGEFAVATP